jgi:hypothetical protein
MSGGYCAMSEHDDRLQELNSAIDSAIERLKEVIAIHEGSSHIVMGVDGFRDELRAIMASLEEVR